MNLLLLRLLCAVTIVRGLELSSRRQLFKALASSAAAATSTGIFLPQPSTAANVETVTDRNQLLAAIARNAPDDEVIAIISKLQDPSQGRGATYPDRLDGQWELVWSFGAEAFSPLLKLPKPLRPDSYQYLGSVAAQEVGQGRIAQGLTGGLLFGSNQLWLSSGAVPLYDKDPSVLEIQPPFRLQLGGRLGSGKPKITLVESESDADFRQVNARTEEAQAAGKNLYQQMYLENNGPGSLRVSSVIAGDPVLVGEIFVHRKL
jgi:hypothetical protein